MNHIYKSIFNKALGVFVAVPEFAASHSKSTQSSSDAVGNTIGGALKTAITTLTLMIWATLVPNQAVAGPGIYINDSNDPSCVAVADSSYYNNSSFFLLAGGSVKHGSSPSSSVAPAPGSYFNFNGGSKNPCLSDGVNGATSKDTQTNRTLFYGSGNSGIDGNDTNNGAQNLSLGGRLDVNSGIIAVGNRGVNGVDSKFRPTNNYKIYGTNTHYQSTNSIRMGTGITLNEGNNKEAAIAIGVDTKATNTGAIAVGWQAEAGYENVAIGQRARATNNQSIAIGAHTSATGDQSTAIGNNTVATGNSAVAIGGDDLDMVSKVGNDWNQSNTAKAYKRLTGDDLVGPTTYISTQAGDAAVAVGVQAKAGGALSTAFGTRTEATGIASLALGVGAKVTRENAVAIGAGSVADNTVVGTPETTATIPTANGQPLTYTFSGGANTTENDIVSFGKVGFERQLKNVAAGKIADGSTDAVNGSQLYAVASKIQTQLTHYYSVKSTEQAAGSNYNNDGATGTNALAAGVKTVATGDSSVAVGTEAKTESQNSIAVGTQAKVSAVDSVAIGLNAQVLPGQPGTPTPTATAVAIGANSKAQNKSAVALGSQAEATGAESAALGSVAKATGASSLAMGPNAQASALSATAVGNTAKASGERAMALGQAANALSRDDTAIGAGATTLAGNGWATAVGIGTQAHGVATLASGYLAKAHGERTTALGAEALASVEFATAIGAKANATGESAIALGKQANASAGTAIAMGKESKATHGGAVALGNKAESTNNQAVAIGEEAKASGQQGSALGYKSQASGMSSTALGLNSVASGGGSTAIGADSKATDSQTIAIGQSSTAAGIFDVSIGYEAHAITAGAHTSTGNNIAIGQAALKDAVNANNNTAIGTSAGYKLKGTHTVSIGTHANLGQEANKSVAIGYRAETSKDSSLAFGNTAKASGVISNAIGTSSKASGNYSNAFGYGAEALGASSIAIGGAQSLNSNTQATKNFSIAVGYNSKAKETNAIAIGANALASGSSSISIGTGNQVTGANSGALGDPSYISGRGTYTIGNDNGTAAAPIAANNAGAFGNGNLMGAGAEDSRIVGNGNNIQQANTFVVGNNVTTTQGNSVVLGAGSTDRAATTETTGVISGITYGTFAGPGSAANGVVSVGKAGGERQIINVAAGNVSPTSTDAINGSQLYATNNVLTNAVNSLDDILGGNAAVTPNGPNAGKFSMTNIGNTGKGNIHEAIAASKTEVKAGNNVTIDDSEQTADGHKVYKVTAEGTKVVHETGSPVVVDQGTRDAATNMTTYKVDLTQAAKDSLAKADTAVQDVKLVGGETNLTLNKANNVVELGLTKTPTFDKVTAGTGANQVVLGNNGVEVGGNVYISNDGLNANNKVIDNVAPGAIAANSKQAVNGGQLHTLKTEGFKVNADNNEEKTNELGSTVSIVAGNATDTSTANLATKVEQDGTGTKVTVSMKNAPTFTGKVTAKGLDASGEKITNVKAGSDNLDAVNFAQLKAVQDAVKVAQSGAWELQGNGTKVKAVGAGDKVNFTHGTGTTAAVTLDPAGVPTVNYSVNTATLSAGQDGKVAPSATGDVFATAEQVAGAINAASFTLASANSGNENTNTAKISAGGKVTVDAGKNLTTTQNGSVITVATKDNVEFTSVKAGDSTLNSDGLTINGGPSITKTGGVNAGGKQIANVASGGTTVTNAANIGDVQTAAAAAKTEVKAGNNVTIDDTEQTADGHKVYKVTAEGTKVVHETGSPVVVDQGTRDAATNMTTYKVDLTQAAKDSLAKADTAVQDVKLVGGETNLTLNKANNVVELGLTKTPTFDKVTAGTGANQVVLGNNGVEVGGNVYISNDGLNANNKVIDNVAPGAIAANSKQAVNGGQLHTLKTEGFKVNADNNEEKTNELGSTVSIVAGNATDTSTANLATKVEQDGTGTKVTVSMKNAPTFTGKVTAKGLDASGEKITNVKAGSDNLDAVNFAQLKAVQDAVKVAQSGAWELQGNGTKVKAVGAGDKVNFTHGTGTTAAVTLDPAGVPTVNYSVNTATLSAGQDGKVAPSATGDVFATAEQVAGAINAASFTLASANSGNENTNTAKISAGGKVTVDAGKNLTTTQNGSVITVATKDNVEFTSVKAGDSTLNSDGLTINGGPSITKTGGVNAGGKQIANVASGGTTVTNAANIGDVQTAAAAAKTEVKAGNNVTIDDTEQTADGHKVYKVTAEGTKVVHETGSPVVVDQGTRDAATNMTTYKVDLTQAAKDSLAKADTAVQDVKLVGGETNLTLNKANNVVELGLTKTPTFDKVTAGTGANQVVLGNNGVEVGGNVYISNDGLNANNKVIDNVAPGAIAANSKQAVNGGQLHTLKTEGFKVNADNNEEKTNELGSTVSIVAGNATDTSTANLATKVEQDGTGTKVTVSMKNAPTFTGKVTAKGLDASGEKITNVKAGSDNLDAVNFAQLKAVQDAVKVAQSGAWELQGNGTKVKAVGAGDKVNFTHGTGTTAAVTLDPAGVPTVNYSVNTATLSAGQDGKVAPSATGDVFATAEQVAGAINAASFTLASANSGNENTNTAKISAGGKVTVDAGKNLTTTQNGSVITVATKDNVEFTSVKAGDSTLNSDGLTINGGPSITKTGGVNAGGKQIANVASGGTTVTNAANIGDVQTAAAAAKTEVKAGNNVTIDDTEQTADGHKVYKVTAEGTKVVHETGSPVVVDQGTRDAATNMTTYKVDLTQAAKDSLAKADTAVQDVKLVGGETNLTLNKANNVVELGLTKTPTFDKVTAGTGANQVVLGNNGVEVGGNVYISNDGLNANNKVIDNVAPGAIAANSKQAVNGGQLHTLKTEGFKVNADNNEEKTNELGSTVSIVAGNATDTSTANLATKVEQDGTGTKVTVSMKNAPTFTGKVTAKGLDASGEKITNVKAGSDNLDAVNFAQLKAVQDAVKVAQSSAWELQGNGTKVKSVGAGDKVNFAHGTGTTAAVTLDPAGVPTVNYSVNTATLSAGQDGKVAPSATGDVFATAEQVAGAINAASFTLASANSGNENTNTAKISAGGKVTVDAGKNLTTTQNGSVITVATKDNVEFTSVKAGDSTLNSDGLTINGGPSITKTGGVNAGGKQIANVASGGTTVTNAANIGDVQTAAAAAKTEVKAGNNVTIDDTEQTADGHKVYKVTAEGTKVVHETGSPVVVDQGTRDAATNMTTYKVDLTQDAKDSLAKVATNAGNITALQNQTFKLQANNDVATPVKASDTVKFIDGDNINITRSGNNITVSTAKDVTFDKVTAGTGANQVVLGNNGVEVGGNVYISNDGLNANNKVISNVAPGAINANSAEAINGSQLHATNVAVQALQAGVAAAQVEVQAGNNVAVDLSKGSKGQNIYTVHAEKTTVSGSNMVNVTAGPRSATGVTNYAVDLSQQAKADIADGIAAKNIVDNKGITFTADSGTTGVKKLGDSVAVNGDNKNITTKATPNGVEVSLNNSISVANISADAVNIKNGPSLNQNGLQMANTPITGMASGLPIDPVTGKPMTTVQIEQGIIDGTIDPAVLQNGVSVSDLAAQAQNAAQVNNIIYGTDSDGNPYVNGNGTMTSAGRAALRTYNVDGKGTYERNGIFSAIKNMNEQGIKFFHTNDGVVQSVKDGTSEEDSNAEAAYSTAIGYKARVEETAVGGLAIGAGARAVSAGSVALGAQSEAADVHVAAGTRDNAYTYGGLNDDHVAGKPTSATSVLSVGKPGAERQVQNVAAGVISETSTDAVNGSQLYQTNRAVENNTRAINQLRGDVHKMDNKLRAGVAGAYAAASLGQVYIPGKTQVSLGSGHYRGESAVALGVSRVSDNGKVQVRLIGSTNTRGDTGAGASVSYLW